MVFIARHFSSSSLERRSKGQILFEWLRNFMGKPMGNCVPFEEFVMFESNSVVAKPAPRKRNILFGEDRTY